MHHPGTDTVLSCIHHWMLSVGRSTFFWATPTIALAGDVFSVVVKSCWLPCKGSFFKVKSCDCPGSIMLLLDPETGKIEDANPAACTFYGYTRETLKGKDMSEINTLSLSELRAEMEQAISERRNYFNFQHRLADGTIRDLEVCSGPIEIRNKMLLFSIIHAISDRKTVEREREHLISELKTALAEIKTLSGLLPICASCKKIRDDKGYWKQLESYIEGHSQATFSHGICGECADALYGEEEWYQKSKAKKLNRKPD